MVIHGLPLSGELELGSRQAEEVVTFHLGLGRSSCSIWSLV